MYSDVQLRLRRTCCRTMVVGMSLILSLALLNADVHPAPVRAQTDEPVDVALDPGHSTWDVGATGGGFREYELTLEVARRTRAVLEEQGLRVRLTRDDSQ